MRSTLVVTFARNRNFKNAILQQHASAFPLTLIYILFHIISELLIKFQFVLVRKFPIAEKLVMYLNDPLVPLHTPELKLGIHTFTLLILRRPM